MSAFDATLLVNPPIRFVLELTLEGNPRYPLPLNLADCGGRGADDDGDGGGAGRRLHARMRRPISPSYSLLDLAGVDAGDDDPLDSCPFAGLCCPNDPLDQVLNLDTSAFGYSFFDSLGLEPSPPRVRCPGPGGGGGDGEEEEEEKDCKSAVERLPFAADARVGALSAPVAGGVSTLGAFPESKLLPLPLPLPYAGFGALTPCSAVGPGASGSGLMATPFAVPDNPLPPLPEARFDARPAVGGGESGMTMPDSVSQNRLLPLPGVRSATPSAPPGTPFRWELAAPSGGVSTTPSDSSLLSDESPPVTNLPKALGLTRPRKRRTGRRPPDWLLTCPLHLVPKTARGGGKSIKELNAGAALSSD
uniref:Uncharacterized protein n=1 Tax=Oryza brachyantha TaxID=4533 RepID=J3N6K2_ORYBR